MRLTFRACRSTRSRSARDRLAITARIFRLQPRRSSLLKAVSRLLDAELLTLLGVEVVYVDARGHGLDSKAKGPGVSEFPGVSGMGRKAWASLKRRMTA